MRQSEAAEVKERLAKHPPILTPFIPTRGLNEVQEVLPAKIDSVLLHDERSEVPRLSGTLWPERRLLICRNLVLNQGGTPTYEPD
jgi:hypothetical protein